MSELTKRGCCFHLFGGSSSEDDELLLLLLLAECLLFLFECLALLSLPNVQRQTLNAAMNDFFDQIVFPSWLFTVV